MPEEISGGSESGSRGDDDRDVILGLSVAAIVLIAIGLGLMMLG
jgi:hypothetical protein